jgi:hypothetical protein
MDRLMLSASFADRTTDDRSSEFTLRLFGSSGRRGAVSEPGSPESRNRRVPDNSEHIYGRFGLESKQLTLQRYKKPMIPDS